MKKTIFGLMLIASMNLFADEPLQLQTPLTTDFQNVLKLVKDSINGWTKLNLDHTRTVWTPHSFYSEKISDPKKWVAQIKELGFCQPDKMWKNFPVLSVSNNQIAEGFEKVAANPNANSTFMTVLTYSETAIVGGKARSISYDYNQSGPSVSITCSAGNELGDVQSIKQTFDIRNPKTFNVEQRKDGKLLEI